MLIKLDPEAKLVGAIGAPSPRIGPLVALTEAGRRYELFAEGLLGQRGGRGKQVVKRAAFVDVETTLPDVPVLEEEKPTA
jgi:hypothetical protein